MKKAIERPVWSAPFDEYKNQHKFIGTTRRGKTFLYEKFIEAQRQHEENIKKDIETIKGRKIEDEQEDDCSDIIDDMRM